MLSSIIDTYNLLFIEYDIRETIVSLAILQVIIIVETQKLFLKATYLLRSVIPLNPLINPDNPTLNMAEVIYIRFLFFQILLLSLCPQNYITNIKICNMNVKSIYIILFYRI